VEEVQLSKKRRKRATNKEDQRRGVEGEREIDLACQTRGTY